MVGMLEKVALQLEMLERLYAEHLEVCDACNYDHDCVACEADSGGGHNCNCHSLYGDHGYGWHLKKALDILKIRSKS